MNSSHVRYYYVVDFLFQCYTECMKIEKEHNRIPQESSERFIPSHMLKEAIFSGMGIRIGGLSSAREGFVITRPGNRTYHILIVTISGNGKFIMEENTVVSSGPGDIFFSHANGQGHIHQPEVNPREPWVFLWLQFDTAQGWLIPPFDDWGLIPGNTPNNALRLSGILESILDEELFIHAEANRLQRLYAELFMIYLQRELHIRDNGRLNWYWNRMNQLWQAVAASPNKTWTLETMSDFVGLSRAQLSRVCVLLYQKSPGEKVKEIRMEHVLSILTHFDYQVSEAAERVGYSNLSNFSAAFKKYFGCSPREVKESGALTRRT